MTAGRTITPKPGDRVRHTQFDKAGTVVAPLDSASFLASLIRTPVVPDGACTVSYWQTRHLEMVAE